MYIHMHVAMCVSMEVLLGRLGVILNSLSVIEQEFCMKTQLNVRCRAILSIYANGTSI